MTPKTVLVVLEGTESGPSVIDSAIAVAKHFGAYIEVLHVKADPREVFPLIGEPAMAGSVELMMAAAERGIASRAASARARFDGACRAAGVTVAATAPATGGLFAIWHEEEGFAADIVARRGRLADLVCVARPQDPNVVPVALEAALMDTGRPVLVVPPETAIMPPRNVAIAWNDSAQAARAVSAALPFLGRAESVTVLTARAGGQDSPAAPGDLSAYLARHNIRASTRLIESDARDAGAALLAAAERLGAGFLVMGGYGHSRVREVIFGGVTRHVLGAARMPVLMVH